MGEEGQKKAFIWGASTAAYQIEGAANEDGRGISIWDTFAHTPGKVKGGDTGDVACDHYHRYAEDCGLMKQLGIGGYRFSTAWPRIMPDGTGQVNEAGLAFYDRLVDELLGKGIDPWLCLYHWDLPQTLQDKGGWANRDIAGWFADYADVVARRFGDRVQHFSTFNEPSVFVMLGHMVGNHAPGLSDVPTTLAAAHHVNLAHGKAIDALRAAAPSAKLGVICAQGVARPVTDSAADLEASRLGELMGNRIFADPMILGTIPKELEPIFASVVRDGDMEAIARPIDFFGINHYFPSYYKSDPSNPLGFGAGGFPEGCPKTTMGWEIAPEAFEEMLLIESKRYGLPIYVMENGRADHAEPDGDGAVRDTDRVAFLASYTAAMEQAVAKGADVRGYFVWSLLDNFEWAEGYAERFGIVHVDYATQKRTPKASFEWYRQRIAKGGLNL